MTSTQIVVVTGCSSGIGLATAKYFLEKNAFIAGIDINDFKSDNLNNIDVAVVNKFAFYKCDITDHESLNETINTIADGSSVIFKSRIERVAKK